MAARPAEPEIVVVGVDGSEAAVRAAHFALAHLRSERARLLVCHVVPWSPFTKQSAEENERRRVAKADETEQAWSDIVQPLVDSVGGAGVEVEGLVQHGHPAEVLCDVARQRGASHLVVGRRGHSRVRALLFGSTPSNLIQLTTVPVTVVP